MHISDNMSNKSSKVFYAALISSRPFRVCSSEVFIRRLQLIHCSSFRLKPTVNGVEKNTAQHRRPKENLLLTWRRWQSQRGGGEAAVELQSNPEIKSPARG